MASGAQASRPTSLRAMVALRLSETPAQKASPRLDCQYARAEPRVGGVGSAVRRPYAT